MQSLRILAHRLWRSGFVLTGLWVLCVGCATAPGDPPLEVSLANLRFTRVTVFETVAEVEVRWDNVSPEDLRVTGSAHRLTVNGVSLGRGLVGKDSVVPRLSSLTQSAEFHLRNFSLARGIQELTRSRVLSYELESAVYVAAPGGGQRTLRLRKTGELDLGGVPPAAPVQ